MCLFLTARSHSGSEIKDQDSLNLFSNLAAAPESRSGAQSKLCETRISFFQFSVETIIKALQLRRDQGKF